MARPRRNTKKTDSDTPAKKMEDQDGGKTGAISNSGVVNQDSHICNQCKQVFTEESDQMLICERCDNFLCIFCANISRSEYSVLQTSAHLHWFCEGCEGAALAAVKEDKLIEAKCSALFQEFMEKELMTRLTSLREEFVKGASGTAKPEGGKKGEEVVKGKADRGKGEDDSVKPLAEMAERDRRKANLVWFGVPVSNSDDAQTRKSDDTIFVKKACSQALGIEVEIASCKRLHSQSQGSEGKNKKPLLVTLKDGTQVDSVLREARKLKDNETFKGVFIKKDCTPLERAEMKKLVEERDQKREATREKKGTETWVIRNGRVVNVNRRNQPVDKPVAEQGVGTIVLEENAEKGRE